MSLAFVFPGQGSQAVGMGKALAEAFPAAREVFSEVDDALNQHLSRLMFEGPLDELTLTENAQPALMAASLAVMRVITREVRFDVAAKVRFVAGHSLGEYSALAAVGAFTLADAARLLKLRGKAMQAAVPVGVGAMAALLGVDLAAARAIASDAAQGEVCDIANDNGAGQVVVSGHKAAVERAIEIAKERGVKRAMALPVSAPFHSALMAPAAQVMAGALKTAIIHTPAVPVVANVTAAPVNGPDDIRARLVEQVTATVRWSESVTFMAGTGGVTRFAELGAGKVLTGLAKRLAPDAEATALGLPADIETFMKTV
ncbi:ACP S-malonyltransferase [Candidatus Raskinella chloraquaticus]|jgi:[acyl-carrier-protein] S-malonyltransferase|uniref:Malonyl CoA-acyl carrier protein transacylase n=1 Tax=Candidatus Raskinella chloraquaticus TaxID=1951219 RepID=A0A1W9HRC2_9HYPH|nr:MAG: malonyl CoA-acyl carrier protein transacylase [Proteobacteria bacterium SG_bin8]